MVDWVKKLFGCFAGLVDSVTARNSVSASAVANTEPVQDVAAPVTPQRPSRLLIAGDEGERLVELVVQALGIEYLGKVYMRGLEDGHWTESDLILKLPNAILVLEIKNWRGEVFIDAEGQWWQDGRHVQNNPVKQNIRHIRSIRRAVAQHLDLSKEEADKLWLTSLVVMTGAPPVGKLAWPSVKIMPLTKLEHEIETIRSWKGMKAERVDRIWKAIVEIARANDAAGAADQHRANWQSHKQRIDRAA